MFGSLVHKAVVRAAGGVAPTEVVADVAVSTLQRFPTVSPTSKICAVAFSDSLSLSCILYKIRAPGNYTGEKPSTKHRFQIPETDQSNLLDFHFSSGVDEEKLGKISILG